MIRVGIVDDHPIVVDGLVHALEREETITVAWSATTLEDARRAIADGTCDVVLVDIRLGVGSGLDLITPPDGGGPAFLVLSSWDRPQYARAAIRRGAAGYVLKTAPLDEVVAAIRTAADGGTAYSAGHSASLQSQDLTPRELDVVRLVAKGLSNDEVAARLRISRKTVEGNLTRLFHRWGVSSRTQLTLRAERDGWLDDGEG